MNIKKFDEIMKIADRVAKRSSIRVQVSCLLIDRKSGRIVATGYNKLGNRRLNGRHSVHAEVDALKKVKKPSTNLIMLLYRTGERLITPCHACQQWIDAYGISEVYHTSKVE
jgi:deoxycytidylate deaminase